MSDLRIEPITKPFSLKFAPPGSKSLTNRALVCAALATGPCTLTNALFADDTQVMLQNLAKLGFDLKIDEPSRTIGIAGHSGAIPNHEAELLCGNSGTTIRFLTALTALGKGKYVLDGIERMRQRPIKPLVDMLKNLGGRINYLMSEGFPPIEVLADTLPGGRVRYGAESSSQLAVRRDDHAAHG
jgi:3-phosphoshikimate 1-carboxyvinyltransferase